MDEKEILDYIPHLSRVAEKLIKATSQTEGVDPMPYVVIGRYEYPIIIVSGTIPTIKLDAIWMINLVADGRSGEMAYGIKRSVKAAYKYCTRSLSNASPPDALALVAETRKFRKLIGDNWALPERHFIIECSLTVTDPITGESITGTAPYKNREALSNALRIQLTRQVYQHEEAENLLDTIEAARAHKEQALPCEVHLRPLAESGVELELSYSVAGMVIAHSDSKVA